MHSTHLYFLTKRSVYIVLADNRKEDTDFFYWLNTVELFGGGSPILIVLNEKFQYKKYVPEEILNTFKHITNVVNINLAENTGLADLAQAFIRTSSGSRISRRAAGAGNHGSPLF